MDGAAYPDTRGRHRLAHHHDQRPRRGRLGRRRNRSRGVHARPAGDDAAPAVVGFKLNGKLPEGATATDLVLFVTQMLRKKGVVGKFVEFYGDGLQRSQSWPTAPPSPTWRPNMAPPSAFSPSMNASLDYLRMTNRPPELVELVEAYAKAQGLFRVDGAPEPVYIRYSLAGSFHRRAVAGRTEAPAGSHQPAGCEAKLPRCRHGSGDRRLKMNGTGD